MRRKVSVSREERRERDGIVKETTTTRGCVR